ncbi:tyrosine-type recombinase/integrase [Halopenitus salinus]|uniref:Tyrosine-type recombinase/integrase n=1 Tax=Halopenitus salinus TaxID=1198295 RepID=A0ABD5V1G8_9EURY
MKINTREQEETELPVPPVAEATNESLQSFSEMIQDDYKQYKITFIRWLMNEGKDTYRGEGFSESTVKTTHYKIDEVYKWLWEQEGEFTKEITQEQATELLDTLMKHSTHPDSYVYTFEKCIRRLFKYKREAQNRDIPEWEHDIPIEPSRNSDDSEKVKDRFYPDEMNRLYEAALEKYSIKSYWNLTSDERAELKRFVAQQQGIKKENVSKEDFKNASSWKYPSIISVTSDLGLRPIEVGKMQPEWIDLDRNMINIPAKESTKNKEAWNCEISSTSRNALKHWLQERQSYEKYDGEDELWLTKYGNRYDARNLNKLLDQLIEGADLQGSNRTLSWYSFRHGVASLWTEKEGIAQAAEQVRHSNLKTTRKYLRTNKRSADNRAEDKW